MNDNECAIFENLMDSDALFLMPNADFVYFLSVLNLNNESMVVETPPMTLGILEDIWFQWISGAGVSDPDRGEGGKYLLVIANY